MQTRPHTQHETSRLHRQEAIDGVSARGGSRRTSTDAGDNELDSYTISIPVPQGPLPEHCPKLHLPTIGKPSNTVIGEQQYFNLNLTKKSFCDYDKNERKVCEPLVQSQPLEIRPPENYQNVGRGKIATNNKNDVYTEESVHDTEPPVIPCPEVILQMLTESIKSKRGGRLAANSLTAVSTMRLQLHSLPYWQRCACSPHRVPTVGERVLPFVLALTPPLRYVVVVTVDTMSRSVVVGAESLLTSVYQSLNEPHLRPCLQRTSEPSLAFLRYDLATAPRKFLSKKKTTSVPTAVTANSDDEGGNVKENRVEDSDDSSGGCCSTSDGSDRDSMSERDNSDRSRSSRSRQTQLVESKYKRKFRTHNKNKPNDKFALTIDNSGTPQKKVNGSCSIILNYSAHMFGDSVCLSSRSNQVHQDNTSCISLDSSDDEDDKIVSILNNGRELRSGMVMVYHQQRLLYAGWPLARYGCTRAAFLAFLANITDTQFK